MDFINKSNLPPADWEKWFRTTMGVRAYDYGASYSVLRNVSKARAYLIAEQHHLCAYCQRKITLSNSSIEHVIPKDFNKSLSTNYTNLVAVCKQQDMDSKRRYHCDKEKGNKIIVPLIFLSNSAPSETTASYYFKANSNGEISPKDSLDEFSKAQVNSFIEILNLNHENLTQNRTKDVLNIHIVNAAKLESKKERGAYWKHWYGIFLNNHSLPHRIFMLIYAGQKIGFN